MAEVATKKSIKAVSNKNNEVCGVQSNKVLIDLDNLTASNNQLISLCDNNDDDDDLTNTNNTRNDLDQDEKSLQELIESELALRICSNTNDSKIADMDKAEETIIQPETIKRIILDRRQNTHDINSEFIAAENQHYSLIKEFNSHQNGHMFPETNTENMKSESVYLSEEEREQQLEIASAILAKKTNDIDFTSHRESVNNNTNNSINAEYQATAFCTNNVDSSSLSDIFIDKWTIPEESVLPSVIFSNRYQQQETKQEHKIMSSHTFIGLPQIHTDQEGRNNDITVNMPVEQTLFLNSQQAGQFSDNFEQVLCQQNQNIDVQKSFKGSSMNKYIEEVDHCRHIDAITCEKGVNSNCIQNNEEVISITFEDKIALITSNEDTNCKLEEKSDKQYNSFNNDINPQLEMSIKTVNATVGKDINKEMSQIVLPSEITKSQTAKSFFEIGSTDYPKDVIENIQNPSNESSSEVSASDLTFIEKTEIVPSNTNVTRHVEQVKDMDSWTTVEQATNLTYLNEEQKNDTTDDNGINDATKDDNGRKYQDFFSPLSLRAPLATPDDETSDISNTWDVSVLFL